VSQIVVETFESLKMEFPNPTVNIKEIMEKYHKAEEEAAAKNGKKARGKDSKKGKK
jgi:hypothetical protein